MTDYERGLYQAKIAGLEKQLEGGYPCSTSNLKQGGAALPAVKILSFA
jgi:hypothetical protein